MRAALECRRTQRNASCLVLSRKKKESIVINDDITDCRCRDTRRQSSLGRRSPKDVPVHRKEVYDAIRQSFRPREEDQSEPRRQTAADDNSY
jgi:carbon storage regulator